MVRARKETGDVSARKERMWAPEMNGCERQKWMDVSAKTERMFIMVRARKETGDVSTRDAMLAFTKPKHNTFTVQTVGLLCHAPF